MTGSGITALVLRDLIKFRRTPIIVFASIVMPIIQLLVLGNAIGGKFKKMPLAVVDHDRGEASRTVKEMLRSVERGSQAVASADWPDEAKALAALRAGTVRGVLIVPRRFSDGLARGENVRLGLVVDNTDAFGASVLERLVAQMGADLRTPRVFRPAPYDLTIARVDLYRHVEYIEYLTPGTIVMAVFISVMIGGGVMFIDDKSRGIHEGYLCTPVTRFEIIAGFTLAGAIKAFVTGALVTVGGAAVAGIPGVLEPRIFGPLLLTLALTSLCLMAFMFALMARVSNPLIPRAIFGILNVILFFPSGAVYPIESFPGWLRAVSVVDPETYAVHAIKSLILKKVGLAAILPDLAFLAVFFVTALFLATLLFKRRL